MSILTRFLERPWVSLDCRSDVHDPLCSCDCRCHTTTSNGKEPFERTDEGAPICPHCGMESETDEFEAHLCWGGAEPSHSSTGGAS